VLLREKSFSCGQFKYAVVIAGVDHLLLFVLKLSAQKLTEAPIKQQMNNRGPGMPADERMSQVRPPPNKAAMTTSIPQSNFFMY